MGAVRGIGSAVLAMAAILLLAAGCASPGPSRISTPDTTPRVEPDGWWYARFQFSWPSEAESPAWHRDLLVAHRIIEPVIDRFRDSIFLWRFHRRAAPDESGHQFSFVFYGTRATARGVFDMIRSNTLVEDMKSSGMLLRDVYDETDRISRPGIEGTSDRSWSAPLQRSWPYFIMGVSMAWLDLIEQFAGDGREKPATFADMEVFYEGINRDIQRTWSAEGGHAFLHHLNALFGYVPVNVRGKGAMRF
ncbi:MAG: hypothetical protein LLG06_15120 [Desulfobacteraceae bacterium]|nr:hypothetical protein [Desulfobacteraceae bacterium]